MATTLYATFSDSDSAERAVGALLDYGVRTQDVSLVRQRNEQTEPQSASGEQPPSNYEPGASRAIDGTYDNLAADRIGDAYDPEVAAKTGITATTASDAGAGAVKGAGLGLGIGSLAAIASIFVPGAGLIAGGGALAVALSGLAGTTGAGAIAGAITGYLKDQGMDSHLAESYGESVTAGGALVSIDVPSEHVDESTARSILDKYAAVQITDYAGRVPRGYIA